MDTIIILGPTAVGKTKYSIEYAKKHNGEIISADSMQVYRGMDIGTAKPHKDEQQGVIHHLIDIRNPDEEWTVSDFVRETQISKSKIQKKGKLPIIVGGTGLYLWALLKGYSFPIVKADQKIREKLEKLPPSALSSRLSAVDPVSSKKIHPNDKKRIVRALEVYELTGKPISELQKSRIVNTKEPESKIIGLKMSRENLYPRIETRIDLMIKKGLVDEVKGLLEKGYTRDLKSMQALGYKEVIDYLNNEYSYDYMVELLKKKTRNFARRQMTWFRRFDKVKWLEVS
ncbi:MAG: tRNA (adenosine(37)-N6)-dimethylallyltransferase MiaA [Candidatus Saganbacteria bacterium]|nr:tRNA (adenosine(37)-N6)-dimethylallyltransferase MiaA [Candidatus Saganbacteria bacterium]